MQISISTISRSIDNASSICFDIKTHHKPIDKMEGRYQKDCFGQTPLQWSIKNYRYKSSKLKNQCFKCFKSDLNIDRCLHYGSSLKELSEAELKVPSITEIQIIASIIHQFCHHPQLWDDIDDLML